VFKRLKSLACGLEEGLQEESHKVATAMAVHPAFNQGYVDSPLMRALICNIARSVAGRGISIEVLPNGGCEASIIYKGVERLFRLRKATRDADGRLDVRVSSDSLLTHRARAMQLFDDESFEPIEPAEQVEQWVLPYLIDPRTRTLKEVFAALPIDTVNEHAPFRLILQDIVQIPHTTPPPSGFRKDDDDLDLGGEEEGDEETG
jgi:hypothetical protein